MPLRVSQDVACESRIAPEYVTRMRWFAWGSWLAWVESTLHPSFTGGSAFDAAGGLTDGLSTLHRTIVLHLYRMIASRAGSFFAALDF
jgi:hypothetical protein